MDDVSAVLQQQISDLKKQLDDLTKQFGMHLGAKPGAALPSTPHPALATQLGTITTTAGTNATIAAQGSRYM